MPAIAPRIPAIAALKSGVSFSALVRVGATAPTSGLAFADLVTDGVGLLDIGVFVGDGESDIDFVFDDVLLGDEPRATLAEADGEIEADGEGLSVGDEVAESETTGDIKLAVALGVMLAVTSVASGVSDAVGVASVGRGVAEGVVDCVGVSVPVGPSVGEGLSDTSGDGVGVSDGSGVGEDDQDVEGVGVSVSVPVGEGEVVGLSDAIGETVAANVAVVVVEGDGVPLDVGEGVGEMLSLAPGERLGVSLGETVGVPDDVTDGVSLGVCDSDVVGEGVGDADMVIDGVCEGEGEGEGDGEGDGLGTPTWHEFTFGPLLPSASVQPRSTWLLPTEAVAQLSSRYWFVEKPPVPSHVADIDAPGMPGAGRHTSAGTTCTESGVLAPLTVAHVSSLS